MRAATHTLLPALLITLGLTACGDDADPAQESSDADPAQESSDAPTSSVESFRARGMRKKAKAHIRSIKTAIYGYYMQNGNWPDDLEILIQKDDSGYRFLEHPTVPKDPWKNEYVYAPPEGLDDLDIISYGRDGQPGGEGEDADIHLVDPQGQ